MLINANSEKRFQFFTIFLFFYYKSTSPEAQIHTSPSTLSPSLPTTIPPLPPRSHSSVASRSLLRRIKVALRSHQSRFCIASESL